MVFAFLLVLGVGFGWLGAGVEAQLEGAGYRATFHLALDEEGELGDWVPSLVQPTVSGEEYRVLSVRPRPSAMLEGAMAASFGVSSLEWYGCERGEDADGRGLLQWLEKGWSQIEAKPQGACDVGTAKGLVRALQPDVFVGELNGESVATTLALESILQGDASPDVLVLRVQGKLGGSVGLPKAPWKSQRARCDPFLLAPEMDGWEEPFSGRCAAMLVNGMQSSGSTLMFNILRLLLEKANARNGGRGGDVGDSFLGEKHARPEWGIKVRKSLPRGTIKKHETGRCGTGPDYAECYCRLVSFRDPRDSLCSQSKRQEKAGNKDGTAEMDAAGRRAWGTLFQGGGWTAAFTRFLSQGSLLARYEDFANSCVIPATARLAVMMGVPFTASEVEDIEYAANVEAIQRIEKLGNNFDKWDKTTHLHGRHRSNSGKEAVFGKCFTPSFNSFLLQPSNPVRHTLHYFGYDNLPSKDAPEALSFPPPGFMVSPSAAMGATDLDFTEQGAPLQETVDTIKLLQEKGYAIQSLDKAHGCPSCIILTMRRTK